jgi:hypothetical protein
MTPSAFKQADPCSLVVFGASGDLMHRLLVPALYNLAAGGLLPDAFALIGVGRSEMSDDALREGLRKSLQQFATRPVEEKLAQRVVGCATYVRGDVRRSWELRSVAANPATDRGRTWHQGQSSVLHGDPAVGVPADRLSAWTIASRVRGKRLLASDHHREAVRH